MFKLANKTTTKNVSKGITKKRRSSPSSGLKSFSTAMRFLSTFTDYERFSRIGYNNITFSLTRMQKLLAEVGNPHRKFKSVHIAGTKGKGSTAYMLTNMLMGSGYKVGLYTSPHLVDLRERIMVDNQMIPEHDFVLSLNKLLPSLRESNEKNRPTFFEVLTCIGFMYFADHEVDMAVIETGLGGRLDSTNVIKPEVSAITMIGYDHMQILGSTLGKIAQEKAGIFKNGVPIVSVPQVPEVKAILTKAAKELKAPLKFTGDDIDFSYRFESSRLTGPHTRICLTTPRSKFEHLPVPLPGEHQAINCGLALAILDTLKEKGYQIDDQQALEGLAKTKLSGRMEMICEDPRILIDGAHNPPSMEALVKTIGQHISYDSMVVIFGCAADKDVDGMLDQIAMGADKVIFTKNGTLRSADPEELSLRFEERTGRMAQWADSVDEAIRIAGSVATRGDIICVTGSFYLAGEAKKLFQSRNGNKN
ncbi:MAG: folylpolyglutamate synthase/dihydrofolate synthase family protein [Phycisphaerae bacterium]